MRGLSIYWVGNCLTKRDVKKMVTQVVLTEELKLQLQVLDYGFKYQNTASSVRLRLEVLDYGFKY